MCIVIVVKLIQNRINRPWNCDRNSANEAILQAAGVFKWVSMSLQDPEKQRRLNKVKYSWPFSPRFSRWANAVRKEKKKRSLYVIQQKGECSCFAVYKNNKWNLCCYSPACDMMSERLSLTELSLCVLHPHMKQDKGDVVLSDCVMLSSFNWLTLHGSASYLLCIFISEVKLDLQLVVMDTQGSRGCQTTYFTWERCHEHWQVSIHLRTHYHTWQ